MEKQIIEILERFFPSNNPCARKRKLILSNQKAAARRIVDLISTPSYNQVTIKEGDTNRNILKDE